MLRSKQKRQYKTWTSEAMTQAVLEVKAGYSSLRKAAQKYEVPKSSLSDRVSGKVEIDSVWGSKPKISIDDEVKLIESAKSRAEMGIGFTKHNFLRAAVEVAKNKGVSFKGQKPSEMWWRRLKGRHANFSLRSPEATGANRHASMTKERVEKFFESLDQVVTSNGLQGKHVWNMDETGLTLAHKPGKVVAAKGAKTVHAKCSTSRELVTVIACANADGNTVPPHVIIPGKTKRSLQSYDIESVRKSTKDDLKNLNISLSESGWTKDGIGRLWFTSTFLPWIGTDRPQLLVCDGHSSHNNIEFVELARKENIIVIELPSHTSHWTQPLDRSFFKSLKNKWNIEIDNFNQITGVPVGHGQFFRLFCKAWESATEPSIIVNGFKATGIFPLNPQAIPAEAYRPASLYSETQEASNPTINGKEKDQEAETLDIQAINHDNVNSISLSVPLVDSNSNSIVLTDLPDLPFVLDNSSNSDLSFDKENMEMAIVSDEKALEVIESTLDTSKLLQFTAAYLSNADLKDPVFSTWKMYKDKLVPKEVVCENSFQTNNLGNTKQKSITPKRQFKPETQYFVITSDEAYLHKKSVQEKKLADQMKKEERMKEREMKRKEKETKSKVKGRGRGKRQKLE